jgi:hypothetical protein
MHLNILAQTSMTKLVGELMKTNMINNTTHVDSISNISRNICSKFTIKLHTNW